MASYPASDQAMPDVCAYLRALGFQSKKIDSCKINSGREKVRELLQSLYVGPMKKSYQAIAGIRYRLCRVPCFTVEFSRARQIKRFR